ncbi:MAG: hypothetical protein U1D30_24070 [Planctomycetota bacterium]
MVTDAAVDAIAHAGYDPIYGAEHGRSYSSGCKTHWRRRSWKVVILLGARSPSTGCADGFVFTSQRKHPRPRRIRSREVYS